MIKKLRSKSWSLRALRKSGFTNEELVRVYTSKPRPSAEYVSPVWHPQITKEQENAFERQQTQALRNIYGYDISAEKMRKKAGIPLLKDCRREACKKFAENCIKSDRFSGWFPTREESARGRREGAEYRLSLIHI